MKEFYALLSSAREVLPLKLLLEQHGSVCPWCHNQSAYATSRREQRGLILSDCIEEIKDRTDLVQLVEARVKLSKSGTKFVGLCPFHNEKSPSFNVVPAKKMFHCFGCNKSGGPIDFVIATEGVSFVEACVRLAKVSGVVLRYEHERDRWFFNCQTGGCPSKSLPKKDRLDEVDFLERHLNLKTREALEAYFRMAGVLKEERLSPSVLPGARARKRAPASEISGETPGVAKVGEDLPSAAPGVPVGETKAATGETQSAANETVPAGNETQPPASEPVATCTAKPGGVQECGKPAKWRHPNFPTGAYCDECRKQAESFFPNNWTELTSEAEVPVLQISNEDELAGAQKAVKRLFAKVGTARAFGKETAKYEALLKQAQDSITRYETVKRTEAAAKEGARAKNARGRGLAALEFFYGQLVLRPEDEKAIWVKRALTSATSAALGYRSNLASNKEILLKMQDLFEWEELVASGLWLPEDRRRKKERRPNSQFCGVGRIRKLKSGERVEKGFWKDDDDWLWGVCEPVLIPYRDASGRLIGLRPHKGMGSAGSLVGTPHLYVPREDKPAPEKFQTVVVTESEFKAAAVSQTMGGEVGACGMPGITFGKHFEVREELDEWLRAVGCRCVKVGFDDEDKSSKPMSKRHDAQIWARYLATDLSQKLHIAGQVIVLPKEWRVEGKADWDGALAKMVHGEKA